MQPFCPLSLNQWPGVLLSVCFLYYKWCIGKVLFAVAYNSQVASCKIVKLQLKLDWICPSVQCQPGGLCRCVDKDSGEPVSRIFIRVNTKLGRFTKPVSKIFIRVNTKLGRFTKPNDWLSCALDDLSNYNTLHRHTSSVTFFWGGGRNKWKTKWSN